MHRSYQSILPCHNKLLQQRWDVTYYNEHRRKVRDAQPVVDTKAPPTYMHLHLKLKKLQTEEERLAVIERDNRILLEKMAYIMRTSGRVDNRNDYEYKSLNREKRQRELLRITRDNQEILRRITMRQAEYDHLKLQRDWIRNQEFMDNISHYPREWWLMTRSGRKRYGKTEEQEKDSSPRNNGEDKNGDAQRRGSESGEDKEEEQEVEGKKGE